MPTPTIPVQSISQPAATGPGKALARSVTAWFVVAAAGQVMFVAYIAAFYGRAAIGGDISRWNDVMGVGLIAGDTMSNGVLAAHLLFAAFITLSGLVQLIPQIRVRVPRFHRWNGRLYMVAAVIMSVGGLWLMWGRVDHFYDTLGKLGTTVNSVLILYCAAQAFSTARARNFAVHRRWALRLFMVVSGVWFLRIGMMLWVLINQAPVGLGDDMGGPAAIALNFLQFLIPLGVLELYFRAQASSSNRRRTATAALVAVCAVVTAVGLILTSLGMWLPHMGG